MLIILKGRDRRKKALRCFCSGFFGWGGRLGFAQTYQGGERPLGTRCYGRPNCFDMFYFLIKCTEKPANVSAR
jgi:hypothetical protein